MRKLKTLLALGFLSFLAAPVAHAQGVAQDTQPDNRPVQQQTQQDNGSKWGLLGLLGLSGLFGLSRRHNEVPSSRHQAYPTPSPTR